MQNAKCKMQNEINNFAFRFAQYYYFNEMISEHSEEIFRNFAFCILHFAF